MEAEIESLRKENEMLKQQLSKYTNPPSYKKYYEANKEKINEKRREYARDYYHKKKEELKNEKCV